MDLRDWFGAVREVDLSTIKHVVRELVFRGRMDRDHTILDKYLLNKSMSCLHVIAWCPRAVDALNATRCILFDDFERSTNGDGYNLIAFDDIKSHFSRMDRTIIGAFNTLRKCLIRRLLSRRDETGRTALQVASTIGNSDLVTYLLQKAREVWYWPNIQRYVMNEHVIHQWIEEQKRKRQAKKEKKKRGSHIEVKIDEENEESVMEQFAHAMSDSNATKSVLKKDMAQLRDVFCEDNKVATAFRPSCVSEGVFARDKMIMAYSEYRSNRYQHLRLEQLNDLSKKEKEQLKKDSKMYIKLRNRLRECSGDDDREAFSRSEDMFLNACRNCGCNP